MRRLKVVEPTLRKLSSLYYRIACIYSTRFISFSLSLITLESALYSRNCKIKSESERRSLVACISRLIAE